MFGTEVVAKLIMVGVL